MGTAQTLSSYDSQVLTSTCRPLSPTPAMPSLLCRVQPSKQNMSFQVFIIFYLVCSASLDTAKLSGSRSPSWQVRLWLSLPLCQCLGWMTELAEAPSNASVGWQLLLQETERTTCTSCNVISIPSLCHSLSETLPISGQKNLIKLSLLKSFTVAPFSQPFAMQEKYTGFLCQLPLKNRCRITCVVLNQSQTLERCDFCTTNQRKANTEPQKQEHHCG